MQLKQSIGFDRAVTYYDDTRGFPAGIDRQLAQFIADKGELTHAHTLTDIGTGTGRLALPLSEHVQRVVGLDLSRLMLERLAQKQPDYAGTVFSVNADVMRMPIASNSLDRALATHILHLVPEPERVLLEAARILKPDGLLLHSWNYSDRRAFAPIWDAWNAVVKSNSAPRENRYQVARDLPSQLGWREQSRHEFTFDAPSTPRQVVDTMQGRYMSSMWELADDVWKNAVKAAESALEQNYADPDTPLVTKNTFFLTVYAPPIV